MATVHLVDSFGNDVPTFEKNAVPFDPWDSPYWDVWHYEISDPAERDALEQAAIAATVDAYDVCQPDNWAALMIAGSLPALSGGAPEPFTPSEEDWRDYRGWSEDLDRRRQVSDDELSQLAAHGCV